MILYSVYLESSVAEHLFGLKSKEQNQLIRLFEKLRSNPFLDGDYIEHDDVGRHIQVLVIGRFAVCYWADHAAKEVKILDLKTAGS